MIDYIKKFIISNEIEAFVVGMPLDQNNKKTDATPLVSRFVKILKKNFPSIPVQIYDERYTSKIAKKAILDAGKNKKYRKEKSNVDKISASLILQSYLQRNNI